MGSRAIRFRAGMGYGSTTPTLVVTRSSHFITAGTRHTVHTAPRSTIRRLIIQEVMVTRILQPAVAVLVRPIPRAVPLPEAVMLIRPVVVEEADPVPQRRRSQAPE